MSSELVPFARPDITEAEIAAVVETMRSGWLTTGPNAAAFEREFVAFLEAKGAPAGLQAIAVNSATAGLHLSYEAIGLGEGDEILVPDWTFTSTAEAARYLGAHPVMVDVDPHTLNIDLDHAATRITDRTVAIAPVHFAGLGVDNTALTEFAQRHNLIVIEDAAHALPTISDGVVIGGHQHAATVFSFYANKTMTTGEGGMVVTPDAELAQRMRTMRLHGISRDVFDRYTSSKPGWQYDVVAPGFKYNLPDTAAAVGRVQLTRADEMAARRREIGARFDEAFADLPLDLPAQPKCGDLHPWHIYVVRIRPEAGIDRDHFIELMSEANIGTSVHFIPLHLHPYWRDTYQLKSTDFPVAHEQFQRAVSLPNFSAMTDDEVERVITATRQILSQPAAVARHG